MCAHCHARMFRDIHLYIYSFAYASTCTYVGVCRHAWMCTHPKPHDAVAESCMAFATAADRRGPRGLMGFVGFIRFRK